MKLLSKSTLVLLTFLPFLFQCQTATESSQWRGPNRDGIFPEENLLKEWPASGPDLIWKFEDLGTGYSSATVLSDKIITLGMEDSTGYIVALSHEGDLLWKKPYGREWNRNYPGPRVTPVVFDGLGYFVSSFGSVYCFNPEDGAMVWSKEIYDITKEGSNYFGITENLIVDENYVYCTPGGEDINVIALDRLDGTLEWESAALSEKNAYGSPIIIKRGEKKFYINSTQNHVFAIEADNGELAWKYELYQKQKIHANTPIFRNGYLLVMDGFNTGTKMLKIASDGYSVKEIWNNQVLDETNGHSVWIDNNIYMAAESKKDFCCVNQKTGEIKYSIDRFSPGTVIAADGLLYVISYNGELGLLEPTDSEFIVKGSMKFEKNKKLYISHPVIKNGRLYIRYEGTLFVYSISA